MHVVFLHGPVAAGKLTIGRLLGERLGLPLFHNHLTVDLVGTLFPFGHPGFVRLREQLWLAAFAEAARAGRSFIFTFNPERSVAPDLVERLEASIRERGGRVHFVELQCSDAAVLARLGNASRGQFGKLTDAELYRRIQAEGGFKYPPLPAPLLTVDTERLSPEAGANAIAAALERTGWGRGSSKGPTLGDAT